MKLLLNAEHQLCHFMPLMRNYLERLPEAKWQNTEIMKGNFPLLIDARLLILTLGATCHQMSFKH